MNFPAGTHVQWVSTDGKNRTSHGELLGYVGSDGEMACVTDPLSGRNPRPIATKRLERFHGETRTHKGWAA